MALASTQARAQAELPTGPQPLILALRLNGVESPLLWQFDLLPDGSLATSAERLRLIGIDLAALGVAADASAVRLADLPGVTYRYIENTQSIEIEAVDAVLTPVVLDAARAPTPFDPGRIEQNFGAVLNYGVYGTYGDGEASVFGQYEARLLTPWGVLSSTGYGNVASEGPEPARHVRLDTYWQHIDARHVVAFTVGDVLAEGGDLGAVYRLGGIQVRRDFGQRADLVTTALPIFTGTAAAPSTVDLYVNGVRYFTGETGPGPFQFRSLPNMGGGVTTTVVLTDALGRETRFEKPTFFSARLLPQGMVDFSLEAGFPRLRYGTKSFDYLDEPAASGSIRYGWQDWLTVMGHAEGMTDFANLGAGVSVRLGGYGVVTARGAASHFRGVTDTRYAIEVEAGVAGINFFGAIERAHAGYQDVVTVTELKSRSVRVQPEPFFDPRSEPILLAFSSASERAGVNFGVFDTGISLTYARLRLPQYEARLGGVSVNRTLFGSVSVWLNAYRDFGDRGDYGLFAGLSIPFGNGMMATSSATRGRFGSTVSARVAHEPADLDNSWGWAVSATEPLSGGFDSQYSGLVRYYSRYATLEASIDRTGDSVRATAYAEGSLVAMGGGLFASRRIDDSFAVVRGGGPHTPVLSNTLSVARTDGTGRALVPSLGSFRENVVSIDPSELAVDLRPAKTEAIVVPGDRAGVIIDFGVELVAGAIVILVDAAGAPLPLGSVAMLKGTDETAVVGYDGRTYLTGLAARNELSVEMEGGAMCAASFDFTPQPGQQVVIGPVACQ